MGEDIICSECRAAPPQFTRLISLTPYTSFVAEKIRQMKYRGHSHIARCMGAQLALFIGEKHPHIIESSSRVVPVPQTFFKTVKRGFNQSALIAKTFTRLTGMEFVPCGLKRIRDISPLPGKGMWERRELTRGSFRINSLKGGEGKNIILLDDVATTLSTLNECARALDVGSEDKIRVSAITVARSL